MIRKLRSYNTPTTVSYHYLTSLIPIMLELLCKTLYILDEMRSLIRVLVQFNYDKKAKELQHTYDSFLSLFD